MAHIHQSIFCNNIKNKFPDHFVNKKVLEVGSQHINGNNNHLFENCEILHLDLGPGRNVDIVCHGADLDHPDGHYDFVISTEAAEHDKRFEETFHNIVRLLKSGGFFLFTCAGLGRGEHGTRRRSPSSSPHTTDFYKNLSESEMRRIIDIDETFDQYEFLDVRYDDKKIEGTIKPHDLHFWGIKK